jgi:hypothetical protein
LTSWQICIQHRFHGPPYCGNGGYSAGSVAEALGSSDCTVTLHRPLPLDRPLELRTRADGTELFDGEEMLASAVPERLDLDVPAPPALAEARAAEERFVGHSRHHFPTCFVCGTQREPGEALRIFPGDIGRQVAATWTPAADLADSDGSVRPVFLWAALDCPGYFSVEQSAGKALLGRITGRIEQPAPVGQPLIVTAWEISSAGRKHQVGTALHDAGGGLVASARSTWITIR